MPAKSPHAEPSGTPSAPEATPRAGALFWQNARTIGGAVLIALLLRVSVVEAYAIEGPSMEPGLLHGDRVFVAKYVYGLSIPFRAESLVQWGAPRLGDVVVLNSPVDSIAIIKRVVGVAGDVIEVRADVVYRNGEALPQHVLGRCTEGTGAEGADGDACRWYASEVGGRSFRTSRARPGFDAPPVRIPADHVYVLGDHRDMSNDSRNPALGPIPVARIRGRGLFVHWSSSPDGPRWARLFRRLD
jgi:signal peptidase I